VKLLFFVALRGFAVKRRHKGAKSMKQALREFVGSKPEPPREAAQFFCRPGETGSFSCDEALTFTVLTYALNEHMSSGDRAVGG